MHESISNADYDKWRRRIAISESGLLTEIYSSMAGNLWPAAALERVSNIADALALAAGSRAAARQTR
jgi:hypothetical protein